MTGVALPRLLAPEGEFADDRGRIVSLPTFPADGALVIESRPGAIRGNHYHRLESHLMYVVSGEMVYLERRDGRVHAVVVPAGQAVVTPPAVEHCTYFTAETVIVVLSDVDRTGVRYETDLVRVPPLDAEVDLTRFLSGA